MRRVFLFGALLELTAASPSSAKCARREQYFCVKGTFERARPELALGPITNRCFGTLKLEGKTVSVVFSDLRPCPKPGESVAGDLSFLCQDTGRWTSAEFAFTPGQELFCGRSAEAATTLARLLAASITKGMRRQEVRDRFSSLKFLEGSFTEKYYLHPHTVLEVSYEEPGGAYSVDNAVNAPVQVKLVELPKP